MSNNHSSCICLEDFTIAYDQRPVLWDVDVKIPENSRTAIIGPNGAGKSTLIKGMLELIPRMSGRVEFMGQSFQEMHSKIAYVPQSSQVNWDFPTTVEDAVLMGRYVHLGWFKRPTKADKYIAKRALEQMGMIDYANRQISQLSGGQKQRVFLARAIAQEALIYIMDEPFTGVDVTTEKVIVDYIKDMQSDGKTSIVVHHNLNTLEEYFDYLLILNKKLIDAGPMEHTFNSQNLAKANMMDVRGVKP